MASAKSYAREIIYDLLMEGYEIIYEWDMDNLLGGSQKLGAMRILNHLAGNHHYKGQQLYEQTVREYRLKWINQGICPDCKTRMRYNLDHGVPYCDQCDREWG